jgi:four helix bundle protein
MKVQTYRELIAWQKSIALAQLVYQCSKGFPREEIYGLTSQMRRAAVSVPSNIAEGQGRATRGEFKQFLCTARGSLFELETQVHIAGKLGYIQDGKAMELMESATEVAKILNGLITSLKP